MTIDTKHSFVSSASGHHAERIYCNVTESRKLQTCGRASVATADFFSLDLGFFYSGQTLEMYVVLLYFPFKNTIVSQA